MACSTDLEGLEVIVGTYEEFVIGYKLSKDKHGKHSFSMSFTNHSQVKSIRALTTVGKYVAAGSADETINLINMAARVEHGSLSQQSGTISCLTEHDGSYLFSGCEDGTICIWKKGSWICEKTLQAHTGGVTDISVHPSGKLALSVGKDKALKTWNLVKGRCGYVTNLKAVGDAVKWSPEGDYYAVSVSNRVDVYNVQTAKVVYSIPVGKRISCLAFMNNTTLIIAGDQENIEVHDIKSSKKLTEFNGHKIRVKSIQYISDIDMLFTSSNDGYIKMWTFQMEDLSKPPSLVASIDTTCRITCMTVLAKVGVSESKDMEEEMETMEEEVGDEISEAEDEDMSNDDNASKSESDLKTDSDNDSDENSISTAKKKRKVDKVKLKKMKPAYDKKASHKIVKKKTQRNK